jgi:hypothetical protein
VPLKIAPVRYKTNNVCFCYSVFKVGGTYSVLMGGRDGKTQLGRPMGRWEDDIKTDI